MSTHLFRSIAATLMVVAIILLSGSPLSSAAFNPAAQGDSCCHPVAGDDEQRQPCDPARGCSCLFCLHLDLPRQIGFFHRPHLSGVPHFPSVLPVLTDFTPTIDYPPEAC
jgi:hypothetical protein